MFLIKQISARLNASKTRNTASEGSQPQMPEITGIDTAFHTNTHPRETGLSPDAMVETRNGWKRAAEIQIGDELGTFDGGFRPVRDVVRNQTMDVPLIHIPGGVLNCDADVTVLPDQHVLLTGKEAETRFHLPVVLIPALNLVGQMDIEMSRTEAQIDTLTLVFDEEEVIWANTGLLLHCPGLDTLDHAPDAFAIAGPRSLRDHDQTMRPVVPQTQTALPIAA